MTKFPHLLAAVEAREKHLNDAEGKDLWAIGAAVIKDCGNPLKEGALLKGAAAHDGSYKVYDTAAKEMAKHGYDYAGKTLQEMAMTVAAFPVSRRHADVNFFCHTQAHNPDLLDWIVKQVGKEKLSGRIVREWVSRWHALQVNKVREKITAAKAKKKQATTLEEKRKAQEEIEKLGTAMPTPKSHLPPPDKESQSELAEMADIMEIDADAMTMVKTLRKNLAALYKVGEVNPDFGDALVEHYEQVVEVATQIVGLLKKAKKNKYQIIEGGKSA